MSIGELTDREAVVSAIKEYDTLGQKAFLKKYGFGPITSYYLF